MAKKQSNKSIDVQLKGGVYTVYTDLMSGHYLSIPDSSWHPPEDAMPSTYLNEADLRFRFKGFDLNIIGEPLQENTKLAENAPTDAEVLAHADSKDVLKAAPNTTMGDHTHFPYNLLEKKLSHDTDFELLKLFSSQTYRLTDKRNKGGKDYLNGMAKVILHLSPDLKEDLMACLFAKNSKSKDDLL